MGADDTGDCLGDGDFACEWACTDRQRSRFEPGEELDLPPQISVASEHRFTAFEQNAAKRRRYRTLASAIEQQHTERALQRGNAAGKARLRDVHLLGRPREVAVAAERDCEADEPQIIHDTQIVSEAAILDIGQIAIPMEHCPTFSSHHAQGMMREANQKGVPEMTPRKAMKFLAGCACLAAVLLASTASAQTAKRPNILVIWGDDIGTWNISHDNRGMMGYQAPDIDRIAREGVGFTDYYVRQSCTAGRAASAGG